MARDTLLPVMFTAAAPVARANTYLEDPAIRFLVDFFQIKGLEVLKREDQQEGWYQDWIDYQAKHRLYASVLSPRGYSSLGYHFDLLKLARFLETFAYFGPAHAYSLHVSLLGLFPILMSTNEPLKREAIAKLEAGGLFAFAVSEKAHGSDLFANEFTISPATAGAWTAVGTKYYIGNANCASMISILAKESGTAETDRGKRAPFAFIAVRPSETPAFRNVEKIRTLGIRTAFVGEFAVVDHPLPESDILSRGRAAWDAVRATINFGKFFLGFGAVGVCEHAFAEAVTHLRTRILYGRPVLALPHIKATTALSYARMAAMKLYAYRALDYLQAASADDRRYLLFNAVQKARVSTEGVKVMGLLSECIGARGFETETYFESALRDAQMIPGLEGSTHINYGLTAQFLPAYFADTDCAPAAPNLLSLSKTIDENPYTWAAHDGNARTVRFPPCLEAYVNLRSVPNVRSFLKQVEAFRAFATGDVSRIPPSVDTGVPLALGKCLSIIVYAQLIAENGQALKVAPALIALIFQTLIEDLGVEAQRLAALFAPRSSPRAMLRRVLRLPRTSATELDAVSELVAEQYGGAGREADTTNCH